VTVAGTVNQDDVIAALDCATLADGPGGPAEMVPGEHHLRLQMYIAQAKGGKFNVVKALGAIDPKESIVTAG
jgi:branched-chain amino acid transport system substrate-binding protein